VYLPHAARIAEALLFSVSVLVAPGLIPEFIIPKQL